MLVGKTFRKRIEKHEIGSSNGVMHQDWKVVEHLGDDVYSCVRVDSTQDPIGAASPQRRTFKEKDILNYIKNNS